MRSNRMRTQDGWTLTSLKCGMMDSPILCLVKLPHECLWCLGKSIQEEAPGQTKDSSLCWPGMYWYLVGWIRAYIHPVPLPTQKHKYHNFATLFQAAHTWEHLMWWAIQLCRVLWCHKPWSDEKFPVSPHHSQSVSHKLAVPVQLLTSCTSCTEVSSTKRYDRYYKEAQSREKGHGGRVSDSTQERQLLWRAVQMWLKMMLWYCIPEIFWPKLVAAISLRVQGIDSTLKKTTQVTDEHQHYDLH